MTPKHKALVQQAIGIFRAAGWTEDGRTRQVAVRVPTLSAPVGNHGRSGGVQREFGGRLRMRFPETGWRVTIGAKTICTYRVQDRKIREMFRALTFDQDGLRKLALLPMRAA